MRIIKPTKGLSKKLVVQGMYENYFIYFYVTLFAFALIVIYMFGELASDAEDSLKLSTFLVVTSVLAIILGGLYLYFTSITTKGETKNYPRGKVRISNKNF